MTLPLSAILGRLQMLCGWKQGRSLLRKKSILAWKWWGCSATSINPKQSGVLELILLEKRNHAFIPDPLSVEHKEKIYEAELASVERGEWDDEYLPPMLRVFYSAYFTLNDPSDVKPFIEENLPRITPGYLFYSSVSSYESLLTPIEETARLSDKVLIATIGAVVIISTLVVFLFLRDRKHELGIYLSLGEKKSRISYQILSKVLVITLVALLVSLMIGYIFADNLSDELIKERIVVRQTSQLLNDYNRNAVYSLGHRLNHTSARDIEGAYDISFTLTYVLTFIGAGMVTMILSTLIATWLALRMSPKKILMQ